jgi:hypothetical protein
MLERLSLTCCLGCIDRFQVKKKQFFRNFVAIMLFGVVGVFISFAIISAGVCHLSIFGQQLSIFVYQHIFASPCVQMWIFDSHKDLLGLQVAVLCFLSLGLGSCLSRIILVRLL